jgi:hypothetical protein
MEVEQRGRLFRLGGRRRGRVHTIGWQLALAGLLLSGCATMPDDGSVDRVDSSHRADPDSQVRVFGVSPQKGERPQQIVRGFLEATTSEEADFSTAKEYLTRRAARGWHPSAHTTVLSGGPSPDGARRSGAGSGSGFTVDVSGKRVAEVDGQHAYAPAKGAYDERFHLSKNAKGEWRIDRLPSGLALGESDFQRIYRPINNYFYAQLKSDSAAVTNGREVLVADPVYLRRRIDPVTATVSALLSGPTEWLDPVVSSSFPPGSRLAPGQHLSLDDSGALSVKLNARGARVGSSRCRMMAQQLLHSVQDQASAKVSEVRLRGPGGDEVCKRTREQAQPFEPGRLNGRVDRQYYVDGQHRVADFQGNGDKGRPVPGVLGRGSVEMGAVGVNRNEREAAAVSRGRRSLYVARLSPNSELGPPLLTSKAKHENEGLSTPSWDGLGDLWVADRDPGDARLLRSRGGREKPKEVAVAGLRKGQRIESVRIASDGVRIALRVRKPDGSRTLQLGRVERSGTARHPKVRVVGLRPVAPQFEDVVAASWAGGSRLVVVGREAGGVQQLQYMETDGSAPSQPTLPGLNDVTGVAASEDESKPLVAESEDGIVRLPPDANWRRLTDAGSGPAYPG